MIDFFHPQCKRKGGLADEAARIATSMLRNASPFPKGGGKGGKEEKGAKDKDKEKDKDAATKKVGIFKLLLFISYLNSAL